MTFEEWWDKRILGMGAIGILEIERRHLYKSAWEAALAEKEKELAELREKIKSYLLMRKLGLEGVNELEALRAAVEKKT